MNQTKRAALMFTALVIAYMLFDYFVLRNPVDASAPRDHRAQTPPQPERRNVNP